MKKLIQNVLKIKGLFIFLFLMSVLLINSCKQNEEKKLVIGYIPIAECVQLYVATDLEYFKMEGIEVELISYAGGAKILNALNAGKLDVGFTNVVSLVLFNANKSNFYSVFGATYETYSKQNHSLLIRSELVKKTPKETFKGLKIALNTPNNIEELMLNKYLKSIGLEPSDVIKEPIDFPRMLPMLENSSIDAASIVEPFITINDNNGSSNIKNYINHYLATTNKSLVATYASSEKILNEKRDLISKFNKAMKKATEYINNNELKTREIIGRYTKIPKELLSKVGLSEFDLKIDESKFEDIINDMISFDFIQKDKVKEVKNMIMDF